MSFLSIIEDIEQNESTTEYGIIRDLMDSSDFQLWTEGFFRVLRIKGRIPLSNMLMVLFLNFRNKKFKSNWTLKNLMVLMRFKNVMKVFKIFAISGKIIFLLIFISSINPKVCKSEGFFTPYRWLLGLKQQTITINS